MALVSASRMPIVTALTIPLSWNDTLAPLYHFPPFISLLITAQLCLFLSFPHSSAVYFCSTIKPNTYKLVVAILFLLVRLYSFLVYIPNFHFPNSIILFWHSVQMQTAHTTALYLEIMDVAFLWAKKEKDNLDLDKDHKSVSVTVWWCVSVRVWVICTIVTAPLMLKVTYLRMFMKYLCCH